MRLGGGGDVVRGVSLVCQGTWRGFHRGCEREWTTNFWLKALGVAWEARSFQSSFLG